MAEILVVSFGSCGFPPGVIRGFVHPPFLSSYFLGQRFWALGCSEHAMNAREHMRFAPDIGQTRAYLAEHS